MKYYTSTTEFNCGIDLHSDRGQLCTQESAERADHLNPVRLVQRPMNPPVSRIELPPAARSEIELQHSATPASDRASPSRRHGR